MKRFISILLFSVFVMFVKVEARTTQPHDIAEDQFKTMQEAHLWCILHGCSCVPCNIYPKNIDSKDIAWFISNNKIQVNESDTFSDLVNKITVELKREYFIETGIALKGMGNGSYYGEIMQEHNSSGQGLGDAWNIFFTTGNFVLGGVGEGSNCSTFNSQAWNNFYTNYKKSITTLFIGEGITSINVRQFAEHPNLRDVYFCGNYVNEINKEAFYHNESIKSMIIDNSVKSLGRSSFAKCYNLTDINLGSKMRVIQKNAFIFCNLKKLELPDKLREIGESAFSQNKYLSKISFGKSKLEIKQYAFQGCKLIRNLHIPKNVKLENKSVFKGV